MNDNQNGFVTRSTSRVLSVPGGKQSIDIFGGGSTSTNTSSTTNNNATSNANGNGAPASNAATAAPPQAPVMAMHEAARNKQRVMGQSFDLFGGPVVAVKKPEQPTETSTSLAAAPIVDNTASATNESPSILPTNTSPKRPISSNQFASSSSTNSYNVITDRPTSRVLQPPGGKCSNIFG
ncbi:predicted protein [Thalassiosira pseudonana CCMP1335]|jgi:hypothetical protein|uniref:Microtubule-associated protein Jupiter n=1 Tax=Thalassiosira pseudonana TaxID=35128 RepID=B8CEW2_THAPS|nr:predicted protein [Thalassiosira pseudonana CCMP1335]EED88105.1 predicted protein [Thalassiosira pseudonana CCMP1335]|eukprot:g7880.t1 g7880   contig26:477524-478063(-)